MSSEQQNFASVFSASDSFNPDTQIEKKLQQRQENFTGEQVLDQFKESSIASDLSLRNQERNALFKNKRIRARIDLNTTQSLKTKLNIPMELFEACNAMTITPNQLNEMVELFNSQNIQEKYKGLVGLRKLLTLNTDAPTQEIIDLSLVGKFVELLSSNYPEFQYEALWCLTNVAAGTADQVNSIINKGGIAKMIELTSSNIEEVQNQAVWTLGNLAGDSQKPRDLIIELGGYKKIISIYASTECPNLLKQTTWTISNFFRVQPLIDSDLIQIAIDPVIRAIFKLNTDPDFMNDACWILSFITEHFKKMIAKILESNVLPTVFKSLNHPSTFLQLSILRIIGNIASGNANQTQKIVDYGILDYLKQTIHHEKKSIRKETAWILSNIASGTQRQIEMLILNDFLPILINTFQKDLPEIQKEAIWAICNFTSIEKPELIEIIIRQNIIQIICDCLKWEDAKYLAVSLEAFGNLLAYGKKRANGGENEVALMAERLGIFDRLEKLQLHPVEIVYEKVLKLLETYFDVENVA